MLLDQATAESVRFIKLGRKSKWWPLARDTNTLRLGFRQFDFALCKAGKWDDAKTAFAATGARTRTGDITRAVNQVQAFFELPESVLWCTIEDGDIWWCFAEAEVIDLYSGDDQAETKSGARMRRVIDCWRNTDVNGNRLRLDSMTTKITKIASFQETIARPSGAADLLRRIRDIQSDSHLRATRALDAMVTAVGNLLDQLHQNDFELLVELIFSSSGWKRISAVGGTQKTLDLAMVLPTTGEHCFVQVKSQTNRSTFRKLVEVLDNSHGYSRMFFVYHTPAEAFDNNAVDRVTVWHRYEIARQTIRAGLVDWILSRTT
jgi:Restriction endonuclease